MPATPDALTRQWFEEVWNQGREDTIDRLLATDATLHGMGPVELKGPADFKVMWRMFRAAFADLHITVERTIVSGDTCVAQCRVRGRHAGDALGGPATGREIDIEGVTITRTNGSQCVEGWDYFDFLGLYQQIGWVANPLVPPTSP